MVVVPAPTRRSICAAVAALAATGLVVLMAFFADTSLTLASRSHAVVASSPRRRLSIVNILALARRFTRVLLLALASVAGPRGIGIGAQVGTETFSQCFLISSGRQVSYFELLPKTVDGHVENVARRQSLLLLLG